MLIVFDTNVLVSALLSPFGPGARILEMLLTGDLQVAYDDRILAEYRDVLTRPRFGFAPDYVAFLLDLLEFEGMSVITLSEPLSLPDVTDEAFLAVAMQVQAPLVTGNQRHYPFPQRSSVVVLSPSEFLAWWREHRH